MYVCVVYEDLERMKIIGLIYFSKVKQIIEYSNKLIRYSDTQERIEEKKYKTFKNLFEIIKVRNHQAVKYFSSLYYFNKKQKKDYLKTKKKAWKQHLKSR